ncbi:hypothetical protein MY9_2083 [Bacillus sp. JS]|nr:hypothetical protein MY9_2083 [Bacillus sp. JS]
MFIDLTGFIHIIKTVTISDNKFTHNYKFTLHSYARHAIFI